MKIADLKPQETKKSARCGCTRQGFRCPEENRLYLILQAARNNFDALNLQPGSAAFLEAYTPVLEARENYHKHFGQCYQASKDGLLQDHINPRLEIE